MFLPYFAGNIGAKQNSFTKRQDDKGRNGWMKKMTFCPMSNVLQFKVLGSMVREERNKVALLEFERDLLTTSRFVQITS